MFQTPTIYQVEPFQSFIGKAVTNPILYRSSYFKPNSLQIKLFQTRYTPDPLRIKLFQTLSFTSKAVSYKSGCFKPDPLPVTLIQTRSFTSKAVPNLILNKGAVSNLRSFVGLYVPNPVLYL